jgi:serine/threonine protein phosphatase PrpC
MKSPDAEQLDFDLRENDMIAIVSDGICSTEIDADWICNILTEASVKNMDTLPKKIIETAKEKGVPSDDRSVCICVVKKAV